MKILILYVLSFTLTAFADPAIDGGWTSNCYAYPTRHSFIAKLHIADSTMILDILQASDNSCSTPGLNIQIAGTISLTGPNNQNFGIQISPRQVVVTLVSSEVVAYYNTKRACGFANWALNTPQDITGLSCDPAVIPNIPPKVDDIYNVQNGMLRFGNFPLLGTSTTPTQLNSNIWFSPAN